MLDIKQLVTFKTAAETLNFTETGKILDFAQSSITAQIKNLEREIGKPLFERLGTRLVLTDAGYILQGYAEKMIQLRKEAIAAINGEELSGVLTIGAQESQLTYRLPPVLQQFKRMFPKVKLVFKPAHSDEMARQHLLKGSLDVAFIMDKKVSADSLIIKELVKENLKLVVTPDHSLHSSFSIEDLKDETLLLTEDGCSYRNMFKETLYSAGIYSSDQIEFASIEAIKQSVIEGLGVALLPEMVVKKELEEGRIKALTWNSSSPSLYTQIAWHKDKQMTDPLQAFIELTLKMLKTVVHN